MCKVAVLLRDKLSGREYPRCVLGPFVNESEANNAANEFSKHNQPYDDCEWRFMNLYVVQ